MITFETFQSSFKKANRFNRYYYYGLCTLIICLGIMLLFSFFTGFPMETKGNGLIALSLSITSLGVYGLFVLAKKYKYRIWNNNLTREQNIDLIQQCYRKYSTLKIDPPGNYYRFRYQKNWWNMSYSIHLFADKGFIAISVEAVDTTNGGFIDFGLSKRKENEFLNYLIDLAYEKTQKLDPILPLASKDQHKT